MMLSVFIQIPQVAHDGVQAPPVAGRLARAAVNDQVVGALGDLRVEVVHQHPHRGLLRPALATDLTAARRSDESRFAHVFFSSNSVLYSTRNRTYRSYGTYKSYPHFQRFSRGAPYENDRASVCIFAHLRRAGLVRRFPKSTNRGSQGRLSAA